MGIIHRWRQSLIQRQERQTIERFHNLYYNGLDGDDSIFLHTQWMNVPCMKCPLDMWIYQEIIFEVQPDLIIETGTYMGGSALFLASILDGLGKGEIITIDINDYGPKPSHPRITYISGSSSDPVLIHSLLEQRPVEQRMVILDADHSKSHVASEMKLLSPYVSQGSYLIVEDTNVNGHPTYPTFGEGPFEAVQEFLQHNQNFIIDKTKEKFLMTFNPGGYLKRI